MADNTHRAKMPENNVNIVLAGRNVMLINGLASDIALLRIL
jgi:hypothetical protein